MVRLPPASVYADSWESSMSSEQYAAKPVVIPHSIGVAGPSIGEGQPGSFSVSALGMKTACKRSQPAARMVRTEAGADMCVSSPKGSRCEQKDAEAWGIPLDHSSEKSCQEHVGHSSMGVLCSHQPHGDGMSSQGSEASQRRSWQESGEQKWESTTPSPEISSSQGTTSKVVPAGLEDADVSSAGPEDEHSAASLRERHTNEQADGADLPAMSGSSAADKAAHARALADMAWADARKKAKRAAGLLAAAQHAAADEVRPAKRQRQRCLRAYVGPPEHILLGARISVYWPDDDAFYKGRIVEVRGADDEVRVIYDDDMEEWLSLVQERFQWLAPRAQSAGGTPQLQMEMAQLGAEGVLDTPHIPDLGSAPGQARQAPPGEEAVGGKVTIHFAGVGVWCRGEVLAFDAAREMHHILYEDGENEWVSLPKDVHAWVPSLPGQSYPAGLAPGVPVPSGKAAIGWRISVYWPEDSTLHDGEIIGFDNVTLRHHVRYDGGDHEHVLLKAVKVCWIMPPTVNTTASGADAASMPSSPSGTATESLPASWSTGNGRTELTPVAELLPFEGELLDEESVRREAEAFSEALVPEHAVHAGQPAMWWLQSAAQRSSLLVPDLPSRRAGTGLIGQAWGQSMGAREGARAAGLHSARLSLPDCCVAGGNAAAAKERADAMVAMPRSLSVPDPPFDDLMTQLGGPVDEEPPISAGLDTLDMHLSSMELTPGMQEMLIESPRPVAHQEGPLGMTSAHGSGNYSSDLRSMVPGVQAQVETAVEDFLCPDGDMSPKEDAPLDTTSCQVVALGSGPLSSKSLASDGTVVRFHYPAHQPAQHALLGSPALSAAATPESQHQLPKWEVHQPCSVPTPAQVLGLTPLPDPSSPADALETSMLLRPRAECADDLELQCLIAEMNWDV